MKCEPLVLLRQTNVHVLEIHVIGINRIPRTRNMTIKISQTRNRTILCCHWRNHRSNSL